MIPTELKFLNSNPDNHHIWGMWNGDPCFIQLSGKRRNNRQKQMVSGNRGTPIYITAPKVLTYWAILHVESEVSYVSCGVAEASDVSFSLALLAESHLLCFKCIIL